MYKLIIFDMDGTLLDTITDIHQCLMETMAKFNFPSFDIETTKGYVGNGIKVLITRAVGGESNYAPELETFFRKIYNDKILDNTTIYKGIIPLLDVLKTKDLILSIISNKSHDLTDKITLASGLDKYFDSWFGGDYFDEKKPSPIPALQVMDKYNTTPNKTIFVGDNYTDIECGYKAGAKTCFCSYGYGKLNNIKPDYIIDSPGSLLKLLEAEL